LRTARYQERKSRAGDTSGIAAESPGIALGHLVCEMRLRALVHNLVIPQTCRTRFSTGQH